MGQLRRREEEERLKEEEERVKKERLKEEETDEERQRKKESSMHSLIKPHSTDVGPPLGSASDKLAARAVQELRMAKASPSIASGEKFLFSSARWPSAASAAASASSSG